MQWWMNSRKWCNVIARKLRQSTNALNYKIFNWRLTRVWKMDLNMHQTAWLFLESTWVATLELSIPRLPRNYKKSKLQRCFTKVFLFMILRWNKYKIWTFVKRYILFQHDSPRLHTTKTTKETIQKCSIIENNLIISIFWGVKETTSVKIAFT